MENREKEGKKEERMKEDKERRKERSGRYGDELMGRICLGVAVDTVTLICCVVEVTDVAGE
jgi:hypothetical protein